MTIPAPDAAKPEATPAAPAAKAQEAGNAPAPEKELGTEQQTAATEAEAKAPEEPKDDAESRRKQRNRERWQAMKQERESAIARAQRAEAELAKIRQSANRDYSQITDPNEELAQRTADRLRAMQADEHQATARNERARAQDAMMQAWDETRAEMTTKYQDFDQVFSQAPLHERAAPFIVESEHGGEIAYWLGKNPDVARDLYVKFERNPAQALVELGRIEARISTPEPRKISAAPKPPAVTVGNGSSPLGFDPFSASADDMATQLRKAGLIR